MFQKLGPLYDTVTSSCVRWREEIEQMVLECSISSIVSMLPHFPNLRMNGCVDPTIL